MNLDHVPAYAEELKEAGIDTRRRIPASASEIRKTREIRKGVKKRNGYITWFQDSVLGKP